MEELMGSETSEAAHEARAMEFANRGVQSQAEGDHQTARQAWLDALDYAEQHLPGNNIIFWLRSGLGDSLLKNNDYHGALEMAGSALEFCASVRAPLASLTMAQAHLRLGDVSRARGYVRQACDLKGESVLNVFSSAELDALGVAMPR